MATRRPVRRTTKKAEPIRVKPEGNPVRCGNCSTYHRPVYHASAADVKACYAATGRFDGTDKAQATLPAQRASRPVRRNVVPPKHSAEDAVRKAVEAEPVSIPIPIRPMNSEPVPNFVALPDGYYAVFIDPIMHGRTETAKRWYWVRITRRRSRYSGQLGQQRMTYAAGDRWLYMNQDSERRFRAAIDQNGIAKSMIDYGCQSKHCGTCGKKLTDPESIKFGIGPDCRKRYWHGRKWLGRENGR